MNSSEIRDVIAQVLGTIAPEVDAASLDLQTPLRDQVDLDSMDWLNVLVGLHDRLKVDIPESDYKQLVSLEDLTNYLVDKTSG
jgi:acyl carrier protein